MDYSNLTPTSKLIKKLQNFATGQITTSGEIPNIGIIDATGSCGTDIASNAAAGARAKGAIVQTIPLPFFGYLNKVNPMTAKYADSFTQTTRATTQAIIKTNLLDGIVLITDCNITAMGVLLGCLQVNCPVLVIATGHISGADILKTQLDQSKIDEVLARTTLPNLICENFFTALKVLGLSPGIKQGGLQLELAYKAGGQIVSHAKDFNTPKRVLTKENLKILVDKKILFPVAQLFTANDIKITPDMFDGIIVRGSAVEQGGFVLPMESTSVNISGRAWVYGSLEDADLALSGGAINEGIVVLQNCAGVCVDTISYVVQAMGLDQKIAVVTDGIASPSQVLTVQMCRPATHENEAFANIQTGDIIEIDLGRGRINTSISSKDMSHRAKRNTVKPKAIYFN